MLPGGTGAGNPPTKKREEKKRKKKRKKYLIYIYGTQYWGPKGSPKHSIGARMRGAEAI